MTVTDPIIRHEPGAPWTVDDLFNVEDETNRYELFDGTLLVSPTSRSPHTRASLRLRHVLDRVAPDDLVVLEGTFGLYISETTLYVPDILVLPGTAIEGDVKGARPADVRLAIEVLSPSNAKHDLVLKRYEYAAAGIPRYWIVDPRERCIIVLTIEQGDTHYSESAVVRAGDRFRADEPFPMDFDIREIF